MRRKKGEGFLRFIIGYKVLLGLLEVAVAANLYSHIGGDSNESFTALAVSFNLDADNMVIAAAIKKAGMMGSNTFRAVTAAVFFFGAMNFIECAGLHLRQRWAEWATVITTGVFIPFELYGIIERVTVLRAVILALNIAVVYYLAKHKELFGKKALPRAH